LIRSFLAIELPKPILKKIEEVEADLKTAHADVRWVSPGKIHLTLKFFGNIEESRTDSIFQSIEESVRSTQPFSLKVQGVGAFPSMKSPRVIWMGLVTGNQILISFQKEIEAQLEKIGFQPEDRPFRPHLTLGRVKSSRGKNDLVGRIEKHKEGEFGNFQVDRVILFKSDLKPSGPTYTALRELRLGR
jgi:2'-5' RNA ligase